MLIRKIIVRKITRLAILVALTTAALAACSTTSIVAKTNPKMVFPLPFTMDQPPLLLPLDFSYLGASTDAEDLNAKVASLVSQKFGDHLVTSQSMAESLGRLAVRFAQDINGAALAETWSLIGEENRKALVKEIDTVRPFLESRLSPSGFAAPNYRPRFLISLHSYGSSASAVIGKAYSLDVYSWGAVYDLQRSEIVSFYSSSQAIADDEKALAEQLALVYENMINYLLEGSQKDKT